jgi:hypothetical protein
VSTPKGTGTETNPPEKISTEKIAASLTVQLRSVLSYSSDSYSSMYSDVTHYTLSPGDTVKLQEAIDRVFYSLEAWHPLTLSSSDKTQITSWMTAYSKDEMSASEVTINIMKLFPDAFPTGTSGFSIIQKGSCIWLRRIDETSFEISVGDSRGNSQLFLATDYVQNFEDLPTFAPNGFKCKVSGDEKYEQDDYYVQFKTDSPSETFGQGTWHETVADGIRNSLNPDTMPHALVHQQDGTFTIETLEWEHRKAGDEDSCPTPSFVGRKLSDIFFHKNRLGLLADDNAILSKAGYFFDFWPESAMTVNDGDPIDYSASHEEVTKLKHAITFQEQLIFFADNHQFTLVSNDDSVLSPASAEISHATSYTSNLKARPVAGGKTVYFAYDNSGNTGIREYLINSATRTKEAADVTSHCPEYLKGTVRKLVVSNDHDTLIVLTDEEPNVIYFYKYFWSGNDKLQSAWHKAVFSAGTEILSIEADKDKLYLIVYRNDGTYLETMSLASQHIADSSSFVPLLDRLVDDTCCSVVYEADKDRTKIVLPYSVYKETVQVINKNTLQALVTVSEHTGNTVYVKGMYSGDFYAGTIYEAAYTFSEQFIRNGDGIAVNQGRLQYTKWELIHGLSGAFVVHVKHDHGTTYKYTYTARTLGSGGNKLGQAVLAAGRFSFPVKSKSDRVNITLTSDSYLPVALLSVEWEANYTTRSKRL